MFPAYFDPAVPGLIPAFTGVLRVEFAWLAAAALVGVGAIVGLVVLDAARSRRRRPQRTPTDRALREAA